MAERFELLSIQVGQPRVMDAAGPADRAWTSAICKQPVTGPVWIGRTNVAGDGQAAPQHGGPEMAVLAYAAGHYERWRAELGRADSRAAVLASLLPADADHDKFMHLLGIHGDPVASRQRIDEARRSGERFEGEAYSYPRAFSYTPTQREQAWLRKHFPNGDVPVVLDPTAGGGSIPFEALRVGCSTLANELNPVAWLVLRGAIACKSWSSSPTPTAWSAFGRCG